MSHKTVDRVFVTLLLALALWLPACGGGNGGGNAPGNPNSTCKNDYFCKNDVCACGVEGTGAACAHPDSDAPDTDKCPAKCKVCS